MAAATRIPGGAAASTRAAERTAEAERAALVARLEGALNARYVIKKAPVSIGAMTLGRTDYRFRGDTSRIAFTESALRLATQTSNPSVARSMVDVAQARNWRGLRVSGAEDFRRLIWLEASVRGIKAAGYEPSPADLDMLRRERDARQASRTEPAPGPMLGPMLGTGTDRPAALDGKEPASGSGRKAVVAAIDAVLSARKVPQAKRAAVLAAVAEKLARAGRDTPVPRVKVYDPSATPQRASPGHAQDPDRARERTSPAPTR
ncbi:LPD7 domain-containing protein [Roseateles sp.]|uniref:LPD7 domain-containing protein n=1 Tax=Roseateles sp. TaxID=1971397 RepID=UPI0039E9AA8C